MLHFADGQRCRILSEDQAILDARNQTFYTPSLNGTGGGFHVLETRNAVRIVFLDIMPAELLWWVHPVTPGPEDCWPWHPS